MYNNEEIEFTASEDSIYNNTMQRLNWQLWNKDQAATQIGVNFAITYGFLKIPLIKNVNGA